MESEEEYIEPINYDNMIMGELAELIDTEIEKYKPMPAGKERNVFRKYVNNLVAIYNRRAKQKIFKDMWWIN